MGKPVGIEGADVILHYLMEKKGNISYPNLDACHPGLQTVSMARGNETRPDGGLGTSGFPVQTRIFILSPVVFKFLPHGRFCAVSPQLHAHWCGFLCGWVTIGDYRPIMACFGRVLGIGGPTERPLQHTVPYGLCARSPPHGCRSPPAIRA